MNPEELFWARAKNPSEKDETPCVHRTLCRFPIFIRILAPLASWLTTKSKRVDQLTVTVNVVCTKVSQQVTTATDFLHQTTVSSVGSFLCCLMCSLRWLISQVRTATCTSTEPVSPSWRAYCAMISLFFLFWDCHDKLLFFMLYPSGRFGIACYQERVSCLFDLLILPRFHLSVKHLCFL